MSLASILLVAVALLLYGWKGVPGLKRKTYDRVRFAWHCHRIICATRQADRHISYPDKRVLLWAHAGYGDGFKYMNSREAINRAIELGFDAVEIDVGVTRDGVPVLTHDFKPNNEHMFDMVPSLSEFLSTPLLGGQHTMALDEFLCEHAYDYAVFSVDSCHFGGKGVDLVDYLDLHASDGLKRRIVYQCYTLEDLRRFTRCCPFGGLHFTLQNDVLGVNRWKVDLLLKVCRAVGITSVSIEDQTITESVRETVGRFANAGFVVSVSGVNALTRCHRWIDVGARCFNTDRLTPSDFNELNEG